MERTHDQSLVKRVFALHVYVQTREVQHTQRAAGGHVAADITTRVEYDTLTA